MLNTLHTGNMGVFALTLEISDQFIENASLFNLSTIIVSFENFTFVKVLFCPNNM